MACLRWSVGSVALSLSLSSPSHGTGGDLPGDDVNGDGWWNVLDVLHTKAPQESLGDDPGSPPEDQAGETLLIDGLPPVVYPGNTASFLIKISNNSTPLFGYSLAVRAVGTGQSRGTVSAIVAMTNSYPSQNLIVAGGEQLDLDFSVIFPWDADGVFISANTADLSTVLAAPDINDVLAQVFLEVPKDVSGQFELQLGQASALSDGDGFAVPFVFNPVTFHVCNLADFNCDCTINVDDLLALINDWGPCVIVPADLDDSGEVDVNDLLVLINSWGLSGVPADINQSGTVDVDDLLLLIGAWGTEVPFCPDVNGDAVVNVDDLLGVIGEWGTPLGCAP